MSEPLRRSTPFLLAGFLALALTACVRGGRLAYPLSLASFTENEVTVEIRLEQENGGQFFLAATFTPEAGHHLYGKDLPAGGVDGLGRPTRLELVPGSGLVAAGELMESVSALPADEPPGLLVYPEGPVTLRLPVQLPEGGGWFDEQVSVTYMACTDGQCCPPVLGKLVALRVPGADIP
jgi:hypothetical protein